MGTISDKLQAVLGSKAAIKAAIIAKGGSAGDVLSQYASAIENLPSGGDDSLMLGLFGVSDYNLEDLPSTITSVPSYRFYNDTTLKRIASDYVTSIGANAFSGSNITHFDFPNLTSIGDRAFHRCLSLTEEINLPEGLITMGEVVFEDCQNTGGITLPSTMTYIPTRICNSCHRMPYFEARGDIATIGGNTFVNCLTMHTFTLSGVTSVPAFGTNMFQSCYALAHIRVPSGLVDAFKAASGWSDYASIIEAI